MTAPSSECDITEFIKSHYRIKEVTDTDSRLYLDCSCKFKTPITEKSSIK